MPQAPSVASDPSQAPSVASDTAEATLAEPVVVVLERLAAQMHGLQEQLDAFIARRNAAVAERASQHVASIVAAAEKSAAEIRAGAEKDALTVRKRLLDEVHAEVERIRSEAEANATRIRAEAEADATRIRSEAHSHAARARQQAIAQASEEIQAVCVRLSEDLQARAGAALARIAGGGRAAPPGAPGATAQGEAAGVAPRKPITNEVYDAVQELQNAASVLEQSLRDLRAAGHEQQPA
jgi:F0F1-type ATP synthase membrane subunit b/b'